MTARLLYARYNVEFTRESPDKMGLKGVDPEKVSKPDSTDGIDDLLRIGEVLARELRLQDFGAFAA